MLKQKEKKTPRLAILSLIAAGTAVILIFTLTPWNFIPTQVTEDVMVHWPDGRTTVGIEPHIEDLKAMFVYAPDTRIEQHPVKIASGQWTSVIGEIEGTFTDPMPLPDGSTIPPMENPSS